jgi:hypothetical protein
MTAEPPRVQLIISVMSDGRINVNGPINDKMTCYGLLECARDAINEHVDKMQRSAIVPVQPVDPMLINPRRNGAANGG